MNSYLGNLLILLANLYMDTESAGDKGFHTNPLRFKMYGNMEKRKC